MSISKLFDGFAKTLKFNIIAILCARVPSREFGKGDNMFCVVGAEGINRIAKTDKKEDSVEESLVFLLGYFIFA